MGRLAWGKTPMKWKDVQKKKEEETPGINAKPTSIH